MIGQPESVAVILSDFGAGCADLLTTCLCADLMTGASDITLLSFGTAGKTVLCCVKGISLRVFSLKGI